MKLSCFSQIIFIAFAVYQAQGNIPVQVHNPVAAQANYPQSSYTANPGAATNYGQSSAAQSYGQTKEQSNTGEEGSYAQDDKTSNLKGHLFEYAFAMSHEPMITDGKGQVVKGNQSPVHAYYHQYHPQLPEMYAPQSEQGASEFEKFFQQATQSTGKSSLSQAFPTQAFPQGSSYQSDQQSEPIEKTEDAYPERGTYRSRKQGPAGNHRPVAYSNVNQKVHAYVQAPAAPTAPKYMSYYPSASNMFFRRRSDDDFPLFSDVTKKAKAKVMKVHMGQENREGKPWGTKLHYIYRDPKAPDNYMEVTEMHVSMNKEMEPEEAASEGSKMFSNFKMEPASAPHFSYEDENDDNFFGPQDSMDF